jgi:metal-responsive CopG/Arc/MetJ family transcriptional regulator
MISSHVIMRTIVDLPDHQVAALAELCEREHISRAEAVRRALDVMLAEKQTVTRDAAFGAWAPRGDSRATVETLREEWSR